MQKHIGRYCYYLDSQTPTGDDNIPIYGIFEVKFSKKLHLYITNGKACRDVALNDIRGEWTSNYCLINEDKDVFFIVVEMIPGSPFETEGEGGYQSYIHLYRKENDYWHGSFQDNKFNKCRQGKIVIYKLKNNESTTSEFPKLKSKLLSTAAQ